MTMINIGDKVEDLITGVTGIATARHTYINGCIRYSVVRPMQTDGTLPDIQAVDEKQLKVLQAGVLPAPELPTPRVKLGDKAVCLVTGFNGTVVSMHEYLDGGTNYLVQPRIQEDGKVPEDRTIHNNIIQKLVDPPVKMEQKPTGGPGDMPAERKAPRF